MPTSETILECGHSRLFPVHPPLIRTRIWCPQCQDTRLVIGRTGYFHARCRDCGRFDVVRENAPKLRQLMFAHLSGHPKHRIILVVIGTSERAVVTLSNHPGTTDVTDTPLPTLAGFEAQTPLF